MNNRLKQEQETLKTMIALYCQKQHGNSPLCESCTEIQTYAIQRLEKCPFGETKPTCGACRIHCYKPIMREQIRTIMRFAGPRMLLEHPILTLLHLSDNLKKKFPVSKKN